MSKRFAVVLCAGLCLTVASTLAPRSAQAASVPAPSVGVATIAFDSNRTGIPGIYTIRMNEGGPTRIADGTEPTWAPGGTRLAFISPADGGRLAIMNANGGCVQYINTPAGVPASPSWSPGGSELAYVVANTLHVVNIFTGADRALALPTYISSPPSNLSLQARGVAWSPIGPELAVVLGTPPSGERMAFINPENGAISELRPVIEVNGAVETEQRPTWTPDGSRVAFFEYTGNDRYEVVSVNPDGTDSANLTSGTGGSGFVSVTPDGTQVLYSIDGNGLYEMSASGGPSTDLSVGGEVGSSSIALVPPGGIGGYRLAGVDGSVYSYGSDCSYGELAGHHLNQPVVDEANSKTGNGYWLVASDGGVFSFGDARFYGSAGALKLNRPVVGMASSATGNGYWLVASDGGLFAYGDAHFFGSTGSLQLNEPVVGMAPTHAGAGYWLVASDGGVFSFGNAHFSGSTGGERLNQPVVGMAASPGGGYWLVAADGGVFSFGGAKFYGSMGGVHLNAPIVGIIATPSGLGYWLVAADGGVFNFGDARYFGSSGGEAIPAGIAGAAL